ncbi:LPS assembly protein LptD [Novosphingobium sp. ZN18A2]|uniref:LPS-assembly protein LptD n=1 Tax=Novosphingobium sp. ZN18A2 TaxID=3079861 RepID=UPI0030CEFBD5
MLALVALPQAAVHAQDAGNAPAQNAPSDAAPGPDGQAAGEKQQVQFEADQVEYDSKNDTITATGAVVLHRGDQSVRADSAVYDRKTGKIVATGHIRLVDENGNVAYSDRVELTDELKAGMIENMLLVLREGGRLAASGGEREDDGMIVLNNAAYTACSVQENNGCPHRPSWRITAARVMIDPRDKRVHFKGGVFHLFGVPVLPLPGISLTTDNRGESGLLLPDFRLSASNGIELSDTYYFRFADNRDLSLTGYVFSDALPMVSGQYRQLTGNGAFQIGGYLTQSRRIPLSTSGTLANSQLDLRGYLETNGRFQFDRHWSLTFSGRISTDRTFLRRYDINRDDRLRSTFNLERIGKDSYFSLAGWATQTLRVGDAQGLVPIALPVMDWRRRFTNIPGVGGKLELQLNTLAITRTGGQDTQRAFAKAQWDLRTITSGGQLVTLTALVRGDAYHSDQNALTTNALYRGETGWQGRGFALAALDVQWPLVGKLLGGTQVLTPHVQIVASPHVRNLTIPNEDSRAVDLEDTNLFSLNRFPGYDRIEDGVRFTYGFDWQLDRPGWRVMSTIGQSYRLSSQNALIPDGTGLSTRQSDIVGRTELRFRDIVKFTWRYRLDKGNLALRRNEVDATIGNHRTYAEIGYLDLNRNIDPAFEDLQDRQELRAAGRVQFAKYWSVFGSAVINLTNDPTNPTLNGDGFQMLRHRLGIAYTDDCLDIGFTWRRDYVTTGDASRGNVFQVTLALRNLGVR